MKKKLDKVLAEFKKEVEQLESPAVAESLRIKYLGRKNGILTKLTSEIKTLPVSKPALI